MKVAVIGATGLVGRQMLDMLEEFNFPVSELIPVASEASVGQSIWFRGQQYTVKPIEIALDAKPNFALFSAGSTVSKTYAPAFAAIGTVVIDNSSAWRMEPHVPLIVPEVNLQAVGQAKLIANPNCSTIQMVVVLEPIRQKYGLKRVVVSTYQSVTGTGKKAVDQLLAEREKKPVEAVYPHPIDLNCIPQCDIFLDNGYTKEEMKLVNETRKILGLPNLAVTATAVRIPVIGGHSEAVNVECEHPFELDELRKTLASAPGVVVLDNPAENIYPMPRYSNGKNEVFVGRIRRDESHPNTVNLWIVADNLRKGAATNAVQIALGLVKQNPVIV